MLKLRRIELQGFKSFYDRAEIAVNGGVTGIVGPNGCGKSNVSDAMAWVLGEQKARSLRGNKMQDVIFNGSGKRSPLGMAEVTISLIDDDPPHTNGGPPPGPVELKVQRRLYRSGESQYLVNGRPSRLRDIQDIFLGTGLGPNHYAIIEQGRIGQLLSAKPTDRRMLIEEAAGITKFRARRKLAESRLEAARNNLSRVNDILSEVERQQNSLKRQAGKARRYREVRRRLREVLAAVFSTRAEQLVDGQERVAAALAGIDTERQELEARIGRLGKQVHESRTAAEAKEKSLDATRERHVATKLDLEKASQQIERLEDQIRALESRDAELAEESGQVTRDIERRQGEITDGRAHLEALDTRLAGQKDALSAAETAFGELATRRREEETAIDQLRNRRFDVIGLEAEIGNGLSGKEELLRRLDAQSARTRDEASEADLELDGCRAKLKAVELEQSSKRAQISRLALERDDVERRLAQLRVELDAARQAASEAHSEEEATRHRLDTIRELSLERAYGTESVQQFFNHVRDEAWKPVGILADFVEVEADYESVIEDLLHSELQYVVVGSLDDAMKALGIVRSTSHGRLDVLVATPESPVPGPGSIEGATPLLDLVRLDPRARFFAGHLADRYIVSDMDRAWDLSNRYPGKTFVARTGEVVTNRVISWGERTAHGPLSLKREMRELDGRREAARRASEHAGARAADLERQVTDSAEASASLARRLQESEKEALGIDHGIRSLVADLERNQQRLRVAESELARLDSERKDLELAMVEAREHLEGVRTEKVSIDEELKTRGETSVRLREEADVESMRVADMRSEVAVTSERGETARRDLAGLESQAAELQIRLGRIREQIEGASQQKIRAGESVATERARRETLTGTVASIDEEIRSMLAELEQFRVTLREAEAAWDEARQAHDTWKDHCNRLQIERTEIDSDLKHLVSMCRSELGESIESVCLDTFVTLSEEELEVYDLEYQELRQKLDSMGNVNMMAVEEYEEAVQRFEFLSAQRQDLLDSIRDTTQAIGEIDAVCRKQFAEAYTGINEKFGVAFQQLFGGGHGELRMIESGDGDDDSDAGIEIVAQPPGKKLQNVLLLSGGEKALTALSLLIALFRFKPSPFCILDEVDAPLDDANVERFANMVRSMSGETQFIVITHSKRTMETASQLYGVTMEEAGVSKVVSVRLS